MRVLDESQEDDTKTETWQTYDKYDRMIRISWFDGAGNPISAGGAHTTAYEYTSRGLVSLETYYDESEQAVAVGGIYGVSRTYTPFGRIDTETWLDENGNPMANAEGYAAVRYDYDLTNASAVEKYFSYYLDTDGEPCEAKNGAWGISMLYYPATMVHEITYLDEDGYAVNITDGYAKLAYEEDENGNRVWEGYYDKHGGQTECKDGYFSRECEYDSAGRLISERYLDRYNKLTNNAEGVAGWNGYYDAEGNLIITSIYDKDRSALPTDQLKGRVEP